MGTSVYLINLSKDTDRLAAMSRQMATIQLPFERIEAVHGTDMPDWLRPYFLNVDGTIASDLIAGEVGCYASHLLLMKRIASGEDAALILEDDLEFSADFPEILGSVDTLPKNWDILKLTASDKRIKVPVAALTPSRNLVKYTRVPVGTGAYVVSPAGARKFLQWKTLRTAPIDQDIRRPWDCRLAIYGVDPAPIRQNVDVSTIASFGEPPRGRIHYPRPRLLEDLSRLIYNLAWIGLSRVLRPYAKP